MLQDFRESISGAAKFIVILIAIPFAFLGIESIFFTGASVEEAANIGGERITRLEVARAIQRRRNLIQQQFGEVDPSTVSDELLYGPVLQDMANAKALENQARDMGMAVASSTLARLLKEVEIFQADGQFSKDNYLNYLARNQYTPQTHRRFIESELLVNQLAQGITSTAFLTNGELQRVVALMEQSRDFHYLTLPLEPVRERMVASAAEVEAYYTQHSAQFVASETVVFDYIELKLGDLTDSVTLDDKVIKAYYDDQLAAAESSRRLFVGHIMIDSQEDGSHNQKLANAQAALEQGNEFAAVARQYSEDLLTAEQGGEIGEFIAADMPPAFQAAVVELDVGQVSSPVEIENGWHLIKVLREEKTIVRSFEEERERMGNELRQQLALDLMPEKVEELGDLAYNNTSLGEVADELGLELKTSPALTRQGIREGTRNGNASAADDIVNNPTVLEVAFSEDVLDNGYASEVLELSQGNVLVLKLKEHQPERTLSLEEVRGQVEEQVKTDKAALELETQGKAYVAQIRAGIAAGETIESVATANDLNWQVSLATQRYAPGVNREVVAQVFELPAATAVPAVRLFSTAAGDVVVYSLDAISEGSEQAQAAEQLGAMGTSLTRASAARDFTAYQKTLVAEADIDLSAFVGSN
ncbi:MAG: SurA N-terminal domain-containing protein [Porticoccaceae bacterium]|nr:SurA N-terminal domain-containing protein [Porticoccaceae bacterium]